MNTLFLFLIVLKHYIVDFPLQTKYQYLNKGDFRHPGGYLHAGLHGFGTLFVIGFTASMTGIFPPIWMVWAAALFEVVTHYLTDYSKVNICKKYNLTPTNSDFYWYFVGLDQFIHIMVLFLIAVVLF